MKRDLLAEVVESVEERVTKLERLLNDMQGQLHLQQRILKAAGITLERQEAGTKVKGPGGREVIVQDEEPNTFYFTGTTRAPGFAGVADLNG